PSSPSVATAAYRLIPETHDAPRLTAKVEMKSIAGNYTRPRRTKFVNDAPLEPANRSISRWLSPSKSDRIPGLFGEPFLSIIGGIHAAVTEKSLCTDSVLILRCRGLSAA